MWRKTVQCSHRDEEQIMRTSGPQQLCLPVVLCVTDPPHSLGSTSSIFSCKLLTRGQSHEISSLETIPPLALLPSGRKEDIARGDTVSLPSGIRLCKQWSPRSWKLHGGKRNRLSLASKHKVVLVSLAATWPRSI